MRRKRTEIEKAHPHLALPRNRSTVRRWAELNVIANNLYEKLSVIGVLDELRTLVDTFRRTVLAQIHLDRELLLTEKSRAEMRGGKGDILLDGAFARIKKIHAERHSETFVAREKVEDVAAE